MISASWLEGEADVVEALDQPVVVEVVEVERLVEVDRRRGDAPVCTSTTISIGGSSSIGLHEPVDHVLGQLDGDEPDLQAVVAEDVGEARRDDGVEAVVLERPRGVLA